MHQGGTGGTEEKQRALRAKKLFLRALQAPWVCSVATRGRRSISAAARRDLHVARDAVAPLL